MPLIAGVDEVGRGAWAGPVIAAAVILPLDQENLEMLLAGVRDSKQLTPQQREALYPRICEAALAVGVGGAGPGEIDSDGIVPATRAAMMRAIAQLARTPDALLIDAVKLPDVALPQRSLFYADTLCLSVAAASVIAKVTRDRMMAQLDCHYPGYGLARHKGYGTPQHRAALAQYGATAIHRHSYAPIRAIT
jgi:ribonuclease HII